MSVSGHNIFYLRILCRYPQVSTSAEGHSCQARQLRPVSARITPLRGKYWTHIRRTIHCCSVADPVSGAFVTPGSGMGEKSGSGSGMNNPDHFRELRNNFLRIWDPGWKKFRSGIRDKHLGSFILRVWFSGIPRSLWMRRRCWAAPPSWSPPSTPGSRPSRFSSGTR